MSKYKVVCGPSMTKQSFAKGCDINHLMKRAQQGAVIPFNSAAPRYGDFSKMPQDYQACLNTVMAADEAFMQLPAALRSKFENDPAVMVDWLNDPTNAQEAVSLGLMAAPAASAEKPAVDDSAAVSTPSSSEPPTPSA